MCIEETSQYLFQRTHIICNVVYKRILIKQLTDTVTLPRATGPEQTLICFFSFIFYTVYFFSLKLYINNKYIIWWEGLWTVRPAGFTISGLFQLRLLISRCEASTVSIDSR